MEGAGRPGDSALPGTGDRRAPHGLWQQQATSSFMGALKEAALRVRDMALVDM